MENNKKCNIIFYNKVCNKKSDLNINRNYICYNHAKLKYNKYVIYIQKIYKGYYYRKKINTLYKNLPIDIQRRVKFYMNEGIYYKRYCNILNKIILKKTINTIEYIGINNIKDVKKYITLKYIYNTYKYYLKYNEILDLNNMKILYVLSSQFIKDITYYYVNKVIGYNDVNIINNIYNNIDFKVITEIDYIDTINIIVQYKKLYKNKYNIIKI